MTIQRNLDRKVMQRRRGAPAWDQLSLQPALARIHFLGRIDFQAVDGRAAPTMTGERRAAFGSPPGAAGSATTHAGTSELAGTMEGTEVPR